MFTAATTTASSINIPLLYFQHVIFPLSCKFGINIFNVANFISHWWLTVTKTLGPMGYFCGSMGKVSSGAPLSHRCYHWIPLIWLWLCSGQKLLQGYLLGVSQYSCLILWLRKVSCICVLELRSYRFVDCFIKSFIFSFQFYHKVWEEVTILWFEVGVGWSL